MRILSKPQLETYKKFSRLSFFAFASNLPNFFLCLATALTANLIVVWVDVLVSFGETLHTMVAWLVGRKLCRETGDRFNFGLGRLEVFASFICDVFLSLGMTGILIGSVLNLKNSVVPSSSVWLFCILKVSNSIFDLIFLLKQRKIYKAHPSKLHETEKNAYRAALINDVTIGIVVFICFLFREHVFVQYFNPIISIILSSYFIFGYIKHIKVSISEITDVSLSIGEQDEIYDIVMSKCGLIKRIVSVNCRQMNSKAHIEVSLVFKDNVTFAEMQGYLTEIREKIELLEPGAEVALVIHPLKEDEKEK